MGRKENETDFSWVGNEERGTKEAQSRCFCRHQTGSSLVNQGIKDVGAPGEWDLSQPCRHCRLKAES